MKNNMLCPCKYGMKLTGGRCMATCPRGPVKTRMKPDKQPYIEIDHKAHSRMLTRMRRTMSAANKGKGE